MAKLRHEISIFLSNITKNTRGLDRYKSVSRPERESLLDHYFQKCFSGLYIFSKNVSENWQVALIGYKPPCIL